MVCLGNICRSPLGEGILKSKVPEEKMIMSFSMLLNLVETSNADNKELLWKFVKKYKKDIEEKDYPIFNDLVGYAIKYFNDVIKKQKKYKIR